MVSRIVDELDNKVYSVMSEKEYRKEVSRLSAMANKRIQRLEQNDLTDAPAYKKFMSQGGGKFGVRGKTWNEVQQEMKRVTGFVNSSTSTIRGVNTTLKEMASNTGIKYDNLKDLQSKAAKFFDLSSKVEQYLRNVEDMGSAIGYQQIWEAINTYTDGAKETLLEGEADLDKMTEYIGDLLRNAPQGKFDTNELDIIDDDWVLLR